MDDAETTGIVPEICTGTQIERDSGAVETIVENDNAVLKVSNTRNTRFRFGR